MDKEKLEIQLILNRDLYKKNIIDINMYNFISNKLLLMIKDNHESLSN
ncbi:MAG: hypothetical protein PHU94_00270 [Bacilli bacterium]|nr:hypothetical protein [Bacilli bacterium]MDD4733560.1 hypothetical protein [Bacilli bacterium]